MSPPEPDSGRRPDPDRKVHPEQQDAGQPGDASSKPLASPATLEQRVAIAPITPLISYAELPQLVAHAHALQQFDRMREDQETIAVFSRQLLPYQQEEGLTTAEVCEIAQEVGIPQQYMERALQFRYPSREQQIEDLNSHGAMPSGELLVQAYWESIRKALYSSLPQDSWLEKPSDDLLNHIYYYQILQRNTKRKFLGWEWTAKKKEKKLIAKLYIPDGDGWFSVELKVYHPLFLRSCGEAILNLNRRLEKYLHKYTVITHYEVK